MQPHNTADRDKRPASKRTADDKKKRTLSIAVQVRQLGLTPYVSISSKMDSACAQSAVRLLPDIKAVYVITSGCTPLVRMRFSKCVASPC